MTLRLLGGKHCTFYQKDISESSEACFDGYNRELDLLLTTLHLRVTLMTSGWGGARWNSRIWGEGGEHGDTRAHWQPSGSKPTGWGWGGLSETDHRDGCLTACGMGSGLPFRVERCWRPRFSYISVSWFQRVYIRHLRFRANSIDSSSLWNTKTVGKC